MVKTKYGNYVKSLSFQDFGQGGFRQGTEMTGEFLGLDVHIKYGAYWTPGRMGREPSLPHVHDFNQIMLWLGSDVNDFGELGAEVELCLGEEMETHMITTSTAVAVPGGLPHLPATVNRMDKRFIFMEVSLASEYKDMLITADRQPSAPVGFNGGKYGKNILPLSFRRKGAWFYGPDNRDDGGGAISFIRTQELGFNFTMLYESIKRAPYRIGPRPDKPHAHANTQVMLFLGTDTDDLSKLGAEFEICVGKEEERHVFTAPTAVVTPPYLPHWPGGVIKIARPIIMVDIHPSGDSLVST